MSCILEHARLLRIHGAVARLILSLSLIGVQVALGQQTGNTPSADAGQTAPTESEGGDLASRANDPSEPLKQLNFDDSYSPAYFGSQGEGNPSRLRGYRFPFCPRNYAIGPAAMGFKEQA